MKKKFLLYFTTVFIVLSVILLISVFFFRKNEDYGEEKGYLIEDSDHTLTLEARIDKWGHDSDAGFYGYVLEPTDNFDRGAYIHFEFPDTENKIMNIIRQDGTIYQFQYVEDHPIDIAKESKIPAGSVIVVEYRTYSTYAKGCFENFICCESIKQLE